MPYKEFSSTFSNATTADFRAWVSAWLQGWADAGLVRTSDTGQINVATVNAPTVSTPVVGYAIFRFDDDLQATAPVFIKITFGGTGTTGLAPHLELTVGKATDGAGNISGVFVGPAAIGRDSTSAAAATTQAHAHYAASGPGWFGFLPFVDSTSDSHCFSLLIERSRDTTGAPTAAGLMVAHEWYSTGSHNLNQATNMMSVYGFNYSTGAYMLGVPPVILPYSINGTPLSQSSSLAAGSIGPVFPWVILAPGCVPWQSCIILSIPSGDYPGGIFTTTLCGHQATFRPVAASNAHSRWGLAPMPRTSSTTVSTYVGPALRWEE